MASTSEYNIFFTLRSNGKTYLVYKGLSEEEAIEVLFRQNVPIVGLDTSVVARGIYSSGNPKLDGQDGFWDIERAE